MIAEDFVRIIHARGRHPRWRAVCPVHQKGSGRNASLTLAIYADKDRIGLWCPTGCRADDIWIALGLTWKDAFYEPWVKLSAAQIEEAKRRRDAEREWEKLRSQCIRIQANHFRHWERIADTLLAYLLSLPDGLHALAVASAWHKCLYIQRVHHERLKRFEPLRKVHGVTSSCRWSG